MCIANTRYCAEIQNADYTFVEHEHRMICAIAVQKKFLTTTYIWLKNEFLLKYENNLSIYKCWERVYFIFKITQELNFAFLHNFIYFVKNLRKRKLEKLQRKL